MQALFEFGARCIHCRACRGVNETYEDTVERNLEIARAIPNDRFPTFETCEGAVEMMWELDSTSSIIGVDEPSRENLCGGLRRNPVAYVDIELFREKLFNGYPPIADFDAFAPRADCQYALTALVCGGVEGHDWRERRYVQSREDVRACLKCSPLNRSIWTMYVKNSRLLARIQKCSPLRIHGFAVVVRYEAEDMRANEFVVWQPVQFACRRIRMNVNALVIGDEDSVKRLFEQGVLYGG
jgi:hypothetical protein